MILDDSNWSHKAWMSQVDANLLERVVQRKAGAVDGTLKVLEWGSGRSSLYFCELLKQMGVDFHWVSLEYDRAFFVEAIQPQLAGRPESRVFLVGGGESDQIHRIAQPDNEAQLDFVVFDRGRLQPFLDNHEADRLVDMEMYINFPGMLGKLFDVILVDGRKRRRCLVEASRLLARDGVVLLHDAYRSYYHCAFQHFRSNRMLGEILWIGSHSETNFLEWIL